MQRQQPLQIFVILHPHPLPSIYPSPCREIPLIYYIKGMGMFLATLDKSSKMNILLGYSQVHHKYSWPLPIIPFHLFLSDSPQICSRPQTGLLGHRPSPLNLNSNSGVNWPLYIYIIERMLYVSNICICRCAEECEREREEKTGSMHGFQNSAIV